MPITQDGIIVPKGPVQKAGPPILLPKRTPKQAVRVGDKTVHTSLVRAATIPAGAPFPRRQPARGGARPLAMPNVTSGRQYGATVPVRREDVIGSSMSPLERADMALTRRIVALIARHYNGHAWAVSVSHEQGVVLINIPLFMGQHYYTIPISMLKSDPGLKLVVRACGEILERYQIPRSAWRAHHFVEAVNKIPPWKRARVGQIPA